MNALWSFERRIIETSFRQHGFWNTAAFKLVALRETSTSRPNECLPETLRTSQHSIALTGPRRPLNWAPIMPRNVASQTANINSSSVTLPRIGTNWCWKSGIKIPGKVSSKYGGQTHSLFFLFYTNQIRYMHVSGVIIRMINIKHILVLHKCWKSEIWRLKPTLLIFILTKPN